MYTSNQIGSSQEDIRIQRPLEENFRSDATVDMSLKRGGALKCTMDINGDALSEAPTRVTGAHLTAEIAMPIFAPAANSNNNGGLEYIIIDTSDGGRGGAIATVIFNAMPIHRGPVVGRSIFMVAENGAVRGNVLNCGGDAKSGVLTVLTTSRAETPFTTVNGGALVLRPDGAISYTAAADFSGYDSFDYIVFDDSGAATATVSFLVTPVNEAP